VKSFGSLPYQIFRIFFPENLEWYRFYKKSIYIFLKFYLFLVKNDFTDIDIEQKDKKSADVTGEHLEGSSI